MRRSTKSSQDEFQRILEERSVVLNLNKLDDLITDAQRRKARATTDSIPIAYVFSPSHQALNIHLIPIPLSPHTLTPINRPHTLPAPTILAAHLAPLQASQQSQLNARIQTISSQNAGLAKTLTEQRMEIESLVGVLEGVVGDLGKAGGVLEAEGAQLARGAREAEEVMAEV